MTTTVEKLIKRNPVVNSEFDIVEVSWEDETYNVLETNLTYEEAQRILGVEPDFSPEFSFDDWE